MPSPAVEIQRARVVYTVESGIRKKSTEIKQIQDVYFGGARILGGIRKGFLTERRQIIINFVIHT